MCSPSFRNPLLQYYPWTVFKSDTKVSDMNTLVDSL